MKLLPTLLIASVLAGCSSISRFTDVTNLVDYRDHKSVKVLEIPADLDAPIFDKTYITTVSDKVALPTTGRLDQVPLVDNNLAPPPPRTVKIVQKGTQVMLQVEGAVGAVWTRTNNVLKGMGMTVSKSEQKSGVIVARDRSLISDSASPIGRFLNKSLGRVNKGAEYQFRVRGSDKLTSIEVTDKAGKALPAATARLILSRLRKGYIK